MLAYCVEGTVEGNGMKPKVTKLHKLRKNHISYIGKNIFSERKKKFYSRGKEKMM